MNLQCSTHPFSTSDTSPTRRGVLDRTLETAEENLALDEALLLEAEDAAEPRETLRLWEPQQTMVVLGRASKVEQEVQAAACQQAGVPLLRRTSGGATIATGPGCLMYALVLNLDARPHLRMVDQAHRQVLGWLTQALGHLAPGLRCGGTSDLVWNGRKLSGNSLQLKRRHLLYHGTLLCQPFPLESVTQLLSMPPRQPDYRAGRSHADFLTQFPCQVSAVRQALLEHWQPATLVAEYRQALVQQLVAEKYSQAEWNLRH